MFLDDKQIGIKEKTQQSAFLDSSLDGKYCQPEFAAMNNENKMVAS